MTQELLAAQGLIPSEEAAVDWVLTPGLTYDRNINGGITADQLTLFGFSFVTDSASRAKAGWTPTLTFDVSARITYGAGAVLTAFSSAKSAYSLDHDLGKTDFTTGLCSANYLGMDWFLDTCLRLNRHVRDLGETKESSASISLDRIFQLGNSVQSVSITPQFETVNDKKRSVIGLGWRGVFPDLGVLSLSVLHGPELEGYSATQRSVSMGLTRNILGAPTRLRVTMDRSTGQKYLGVPRIDDKVTVTTTRQIGTWAEVFAGYETVQSSIDGFDDQAVLFGFNLTGWSPAP